MKLIGISGSLRKKSFNTALLRALETMASNEIHIERAMPLDSLPYFNPDQDTDSPLSEVKKWRDQIESADALVFFTPEYAHNMSGVLKNAIDWLVSSPVIDQKPVAVIASSTSYLGGTLAHESLCHLMDVVSGRLVKEASVCFPMANKLFDEHGNLKDEDAKEKLHSCLIALTDYVKKT